jgi:peroxiredoxin
MLKKMVYAMCALGLLAAAPGYAAQAVVGDPAKDFTLKSMEGKDFTLATFKDQKPVVLVFWQSACGSCVADMKFMSEQKGKFDKLEFAAINVDNRGGTEAWKENMNKYLSEQKVTIQVLLDPQYAIARLYGIGATPSTVMIGKDGKIANVFMGFNPGSDEAAITAALGKLQ